MAADGCRLQGYRIADKESRAPEPLTGRGGGAGASELAGVVAGKAPFGGFPIEALSLIHI